jgi:hypothetical protein
MNLTSVCTSILIFSLALLGYFRTIFKSYFSHECKPGVSVLLTKPKDLDYELFILSNYQSFCEYLLSKKESRTGTLDDDLILIANWEQMGLSYTRKMTVVYRCEKKKILATNIDLCKYLLKIVKRVKEGGVGFEEYRKMCLEKTEIESTKGLLKKWVYNADAVFSEEEQYFRRRVAISGYLKDLAELAGIPTSP